MKAKVLCDIPEDAEIDGGFDCVEFVKAIYGLKQAFVVCGTRLSTNLCARSDSKCRILTRVYTSKWLKGTASCYRSTWMTHWCPAAHSTLIAQTKINIKARSKMNDSNKCTFAMAIVLVDGPYGCVTMCQWRYVDDI